MGSREGTKRDDKGKAKEVGRQGPPPLRADQISRGAPPPGDANRPTPVEYVAGMAERELKKRVLTSEPGGPSDEWKAEQREIIGQDESSSEELPPNIRRIFAKEKRQAETPEEEGSAKKPGVASGDNPLQHEAERTNRYIRNFMNYAQNNGESLDAALGSVGMDRSKLSETFGSVKQISDIDTLRTINMRLDEIEKSVEVKRVNRHIRNFMNYAQNNGESLDAALGSVGMDRKELSETLGSVKQISDIDTLRTINMRLDEIEKSVKFMKGMELWKAEKRE